MELVFVLGRDWKLSMLELASALKARGLEFRAICFDTKTVLLSLPEDFRLREFFSALGGTQKACRVIWKGSRARLGNEGLGELEKFLGAQYFDKKLLFGVSDYLEEGNSRNEAMLVAECLKRHFKKNRVKAVFKKPKRHSEEKYEPKAINPGDCMAWKLMKDKTEFVVSCGANKEIVISGTVQCFDPGDFEERDKAMPNREKLEGISIRLARLLLNLAGANGSKTVLDPFCGTGRVLVEAGLLGFNSIGVELSQERCSKSEKNLKWARESFGIKPVSKVYCNDCTRIAGFLKKGEFDSVATEPYMGPLLTRALSRGEAVKIAQELERTYFALFRELGKIIPKSGLVAIVLPVIPYFDKLAKGSAMVSDRVWQKNGFALHNELGELLPRALPYDYMPEKSRIGRRILVLARAE